MAAAGGCAGRRTTAQVNQAWVEWSEGVVVVGMDGAACHALAHRICSAARLFLHVGAFTALLARYRSGMAHVSRQIARVRWVWWVVRGYQAVAVSRLNIDGGWRARRLNPPPAVARASARCTPSAAHAQHLPSPYSAYAYPQLPISR